MSTIRPRDIMKRIVIESVLYMLRYVSFSIVVSKLKKEIIEDFIEEVKEDSL